MATRRRQFGLRPCIALAPKTRHHRPLEVARDFFGLVEAPSPQPSRVKGNRHDGIGVEQQIAALRSHQGGEIRSDRAPAFVFQGMDDRPKRAFVVPGRAAPVDVPSRSPASGAGAPLERRHPPRRQRVAAQPAGRRGNQTDPIPTSITHGAVEWMDQDGLASRAARREQQREQAVDGRSDSAVGPSTLGPPTSDGSLGEPGRHVGDVEPHGAAPEPLEIVEPPGVRREGVDDEVEAVDKDPLRAVVALDV